MVVSVVWGRKSQSKEGDDLDSNRETVFVNAASLTGFWDEKKNPAIVVDI